MKYDYISDIHAGSLSETDLKIIGKSNPNTHLIIGGDISDGDKDPVKLLNYLLKLYDTILYVDGNHEHYMSGKTIEEQEQYFKDSSTEKVNYLFNKPYLVDDIAFVGCNGWYDFNCHHSSDSNMVFVDYKQRMNDHRFIKNIDSFQQMMDLATRHANTLEENIKDVYDSVNKIVVITHVAPDPMFLVERGHPWYDLNGSFCNTQFKGIIDKYGDKITNWHYGHTHLTDDRVVNGIRYINNAFGYNHERPHSAKIKEYPV